MALKNEYLALMARARQIIEHLPEDIRVLDFNGLESVKVGEKYRLFGMGIQLSGGLEALDAVESTFGKGERNVREWSGGAIHYLFYADVSFCVCVDKELGKVMEELDSDNPCPDVEMETPDDENPEPDADEDPGAESEAPDDG